MKNVSKNLFAEAPKFIAVLDPKNLDADMISVALESEELLDVMNEADKHFGEDTYQIHILQKNGAEARITGVTYILYTEVMVSYSKGFYKRSDNSEFAMRYNPNREADDFTDKVDFAA